MLKVTKFALETTLPKLDCDILCIGFLFFRLGFLGTVMGFK
jgi:hypothetical protein